MPRRSAWGSLSFATLALFACKTEQQEAPGPSEQERANRSPDGGAELPASGGTASGGAAVQSAEPSRFVSDWPRPSELGPFDPEVRFRPVAKQQTYLLDLLRAYEQLADAEYQRVEQLVRASEYLSFGNPQVSQPAFSQQECHQVWRERERPRADESCGHRNMARVPSSQLCVDLFEFPNVLCEYPVVWTRASEAQELCAALGKRLCDAHEWEGACAGSLGAPEAEYEYSRVPQGAGPEYRRARRILMEGWHNLSRPVVWAYGAEKNHALCATGSRKSPGCDAVDYRHCGTNNYPSGSFPDCRTRSGIFDQHGNVAEHMSFPLYPAELGGRGYTEMKGSWFLFAREETHPDDCRWRAKNWHTTKVSDPNSHRNYHLGFRCCAERAAPP